MDTNPYRYDPSIDDDIFDSVEKPPTVSDKHPSDGRLCIECGIIHDFSNIPEDKLPELMEILDKVPSFVAKEILADHEYQDVPAKMVASFFSYAHSLDMFDKTMPLLRALAVVVDSLTDGNVSRLYGLFLIEQDLLAAHHALQSANNALELALAHDHSQKQDNFVHGLNFLVQITTDRIQDISDFYREVCAEYDIEPNEELLFHGSIVGSSDIALHLTKNEMYNSEG